MSYTEPSYIETAKMLSDGTSLAPPMSDLASWIAGQYDVAAPINIRLVNIDPLRIKKRLRVIFRAERDAKLFNRANSVNYDSKRAARIIEKFRELAEGTPLAPRRNAQLFVTFSSFEKASRWRANSAIPDDQIERLEAELAGHNIWKVYPLFDAVVFFFHTDVQLSASLVSGAREACQAVYARALKPYDHHGFFTNRPIEAHFDSKETFERDFGGSWFAYTR